MIALLCRWFIKNREQTSDPIVRRSYGTLAGIVGICLNILLFLIKYLAGTAAASIAIIGDAFNNLSDAGSSLVTLIGFQFAGRKPDADHPFGHGRIEYIAGFIVSVAIVLMGFELGQNAIDKILHPAPVETGLLSIVILVISICVKLYMCLYNRSLGRRINSAVMNATAADSLGDAVATAVVLLSVLIMRFTGINIDGWCGLLVAAFILYAGYSAARDTLSPLLGNPPDPALVEKIRDIVLSHPLVVGMHDLVVHDYGPGRIMVSLHGEVRGDSDVYTLHDMIDHIERELEEQVGCSAVIHMDPIAADNSPVARLQAEVESLAAAVHPALSIHDFRVIASQDGTQYLFDLVIPPEAGVSDGDVTAQLTQAVQKNHPEAQVLIRVDRAEVI